MKKGLFLLLLFMSIFLLGAVGIATHFAAQHDSPLANFDPELSLKPFTISELLAGEIEVDIETSSKPIESEKLSTIEDRTSQLRQLPLLNPVKFVTSPEDVLRYQLLKDLAEEVTADELDADQKLMEELGLIGRDDDLGDILTRVYTEQIAGTYDPETKNISIMEGKSTGELTDEVTLSHEVTHALQDQNYDLQKPPLDNESYNGDNFTAVESLIEGDATYTMYKYAEDYIDISRLQKEINEMPETSSEELDKAPFYIRKSLLFPYEGGLVFVKALIERNGEAGVDNAFRDPPLSTEQILHPEKYIDRSDNPKEVTVPDVKSVFGEDWEAINSDCLGEYDVSLWFEQYAGLLAAREVSKGWGGNKIEYWEGPKEEFVLVNLFTWDTPLDAKEFYSGYKELLEGRFGGGLKKSIDGPDMYIYEAEGEYFYCGIAGNNTLCLQSKDKKLLDKTIEAFPEYKTGNQQ